MAWTTPTTRSTGDLITAAIWNTDLVDNLSYLKGADSQQGARVRHSTTQTCANGAELAIAFDTEDFDTDTIHDTAITNSRLVCKTAGKYLIYGGIALDNSGRYTLRLRVNGATVIASANNQRDADEASRYPLGPVMTIYNLAVNDYVELMFRNDSGATRTIQAVNGWTPHFGMQRIG